MSRGAGCGKSARPDLWGAWGGEPPWVYPTGEGVFARHEHDRNHMLTGLPCLQVAGFYQADPPPEPEPEPRSSSLAGSHGGGSGGVASGASGLGLPNDSIIGKGGPNPEFDYLYEIQPGAELTWPDGSSAGVVVERFWTQQKPKRRGKRRCFVKYLARYGPESLPYCVASKDAEFVGGSGRRI